MKATRIARSIALASALAGAASGALAAPVQGSLGSPSVGKLGVQVQIPTRARIQGLNDIDLGSYSGENNLVGSDDFCVYSNTAGNYDLTVASANTSDGTFKVKDTASGNVVEYDVKVTDAMATEFAPVSGTQLVDLSGSSASVSCGNSSNTSLEVTFLATNLQAALASGTYTDTITLTVAPK